MSFTVVIPARYQSSRLPGKPLLLLAGKPMIGHVVERAQRSQASAVYVATDDKRVEAACRDLGVSVCMTSAGHVSGTDRIEEVCRQLQLHDDEIIINVQGDEPLIPPAVINQLAGNMRANPDAGICSVYENLHHESDRHNPNVVKVVTDENDMALYFSRAPIPCIRDAGQASAQAVHKRHIGLYAYRVRVLKQFVAWPPNVLEDTEKLEQLRALANGVRIHMAHCCEPVPPGVDTQADLDQVRAILEPPI